MARKLKKLAKAQKGYVGEVEELGFMLDPDVAYTSSRGVPGGQPEYKAIIYYDPYDRDGFFTSDLERMTPELNERYGVGNWFAKGHYLIQIILMLIKLFMMKMKKIRI